HHDGRVTGEWAGRREGNGRGIDIAVWGDGYPRVGVTRKGCTEGIRGVETGDRRRRRPRGAGEVGGVGVVGHAHHQGSGAAHATEAVLLPDGDSMGRIRGVHSDLWLHFTINEHRGARSGWGQWTAVRYLFERGQRHAARNAAVFQVFDPKAHTSLGRPAQWP